MKIIDASGLVLGRLASYAAKIALSGEKVTIVNCEKAVISGDEKKIFAHYHHKLERGDALKGPYFPRQPDRIVRRTIRGMLPHKQARGREAFKRVMCYVGVPREFADQPIGTLTGAEVAKLATSKYITIKQLASRIGK